MLHNVSASVGSRLRTTAHIVALRAAWGSFRQMELSGGGATQELPSSSGQIVIFPQWLFSPAQIVMWKWIPVISCPLFDATFSESCCFSRRNNHPTRCAPVCIPVAPPWRCPFSVSVGPKDDHLTRFEQLFDQGGFSF